MGRYLSEAKNGIYNQLLYWSLTSPPNRCCKNESYDIRKNYCCQKIIPRNSNGGQNGGQCCAGHMIDTRKFICCGYGPIRRKRGENNACCKTDTYTYKMYDKNSHICCSGSLRPRLPVPAVSACCINRVYDVRREMCCNEQVLSFSWLFQKKDFLVFLLFH